MHFTSLFVFVLFFALHSNAQELYYKAYDWDSLPALHALHPTEEQEEEITLRDKRIIQFAYDEQSTLQEYSLKHIIVRVNSDKAIKRNNRIYIPFSSSGEILIEKARVVTSKGEVKTLNRDDIKEAKDEETNRIYRFFAVEGVDLGSEIEYLYVIKKAPAYTGSRLLLQSDEIIKNLEVDLISPENLVFTSRSYNGLPEMEEDTTFEEVNYLRLRVDSIPKCIEEESATYTPHLMQLIYKLEKNMYRGKRDVISFEEAAKAVYQSIYQHDNKKIDKGIQKLIKQGDFERYEDLEEQVRAVEHYLKSNYPVREGSGGPLSELEFVLENKVCNETGINRLFANVLRALEIEHQVVLTSERDELPFDPDFEAYNFLQNYLIYINKLDAYLAPSSMFHRLGYVPTNWVHNYGMFIEPLQLGGFETAIQKVKFIDAPAYDKSKDDLYVNVTFGEDLRKLNIDLRRESTGYYAQYTQPYYGFLNEEQKKETNEALVKNISPDAEISTIDTENEGVTYFGSAPFKITATLTSSAFIEKAGSKYLFKVGELIGPQIEMYQEEERKFEVENEFNKKYYREITFTIPEGYAIKDLDKLKMNVTHEHEGDTTMAFISNYTLEGREVKVVIEEYYKRIIYPLEWFEAYRNVINAAADFNKVMLLVVKEEG